MHGTRYRQWAVVLHAREHLAPSKTMAYDEVVAVDLEVFAFLDPALQYIFDVTPATEHIFGFTLDEAVDRFKAACRLAQLEVLAPMLYQLRHSGPSADLALRRRSVAAVKLRGRWATDRSMGRYLKEARVGQQALAATERLAALLARPSEAPWPTQRDATSSRRSL